MKTHRKQATSWQPTAAARRFTDRLDAAAGSGAGGTAQPRPVWVRSPVKVVITVAATSRTFARVRPALASSGTLAPSPLLRARQGQGRAGHSGRAAR